MITEQPEDWESPLTNWFNTELLDQPITMVLAMKPDGTIEKMTRRKFESLSTFLSLKEVTHE